MDRRKSFKTKEYRGQQRHDMTRQHVIFCEWRIKGGHKIEHSVDEMTQRHGKHHVIISPSSRCHDNVINFIT